MNFKFRQEGVFKNKTYLSKNVYDNIKVIINRSCFNPYFSGSVNGAGVEAMKIWIVNPFYNNFLSNIKYLYSIGVR